MPILHLTLLIFAFVLFVLAGFNISHPRVSLLALGLALWVLTLILRTSAP